MSNNIIGLIRIHRCPITDICTSCEVCSYIPNCDLSRKPQQAETGNSTNTVESDHQYSELVPITNDGGDDYGNDGVEVGWG